MQLKDTFRWPSFVIGGGFCGARVVVVVFRTKSGALIRYLSRTDSVEGAQQKDEVALREMRCAEECLNAHSNV